MLTYRLTGTTEASGSTTTNKISISASHNGPQQQSGAESSHPMVRDRRRFADLQKLPPQAGPLRQFDSGR
jgi:hypothetical protein